MYFELKCHWISISRMFKAKWQIRLTKLLNFVKFNSEFSFCKQKCKKSLEIPYISELLFLRNAYIHLEGKVFSFVVVGYTAREMCFGNVLKGKNNTIYCS